MNAFAPPEIQTAAPLALVVNTDSRDRALVEEYLRTKSLRKTAEAMCVSHETVSNALGRFAVSLSLAKKRRLTVTVGAVGTVAGPETAR